MRILSRHAPIRHVGTVLLALVAVGLAGLTIWGVISGRHQDSPRGQAQLAVVLLVEVGGGAVLLILAVTAAQWIRAGRGSGHGRALRWTLVFIVAWLVWAYCRVGEYAS